MVRLEVELTQRCASWDWTRNTSWNEWLPVLSEEETFRRIGTAVRVDCSVLLCGVVLHPALELRELVIYSGWNFDAGNLAVQCWVSYRRVL